MSNNIYNSYFFNEFYQENGGGNYTDSKNWMPFFEMIAERISEIFNPKTVLDAGCACGYLVAALRDKGIEAFGIDISDYAINNAREDIKPFLNVQSITDKLPESFPKKYDLVMTIEVLEHLFPEDGKNAIALLCRYSDTVLFTSTPSDIEDKTHVNVQQKEYWAKIFAEQFFYRDLFQPVNFICEWAMLFRKRDDISKVIFEYELSDRVDAIKRTSKEESKRKLFKCYYRLENSDGYSEEYCKNIVYTQDEKCFVVEIREKEKICGLRIDPMESCCIIKHFHVYNLLNDRGELEVKASNGIVNRSRVVFGSNDPMVEMRVPENDGTLRLEVCFELEHSEISLITDIYHMLLGDKKYVNRLVEEHMTSMKYAEENIVKLRKMCTNLQNEKGAVEYEFEKNKKELEEEIEMLTEELLNKINVHNEMEVNLKQVYEERIQRLQERCDDLEKQNRNILFEQIETLKEKELLSIRFDESNRQKQWLEEKYSADMKTANKEKDKIKEVLEKLSEQTGYETEKLREEKQQLKLNLEQLKLSQEINYDKIKRTYEEENKKLEATLVKKLEEKQTLIEELREKKKDLEQLLETEKRSITNLGAEYETKVELLEETKKELENLLQVRENEFEKEKQEELLAISNEWDAKLAECESVCSDRIRQVSARYADIEASLEDYKQCYIGEMNQTTALKIQCDYYVQAYNQIANSQFWKITAPLRKILDVIKKNLKSNKVTYLFCKGLISLKNNGLKKTLEIMKLRRQQRKNRNKLAQETVEVQLTELQENVEISNAILEMTGVRFSILVPLYNTPEIFLREMIQSVMNQTYGNWELCLADGSDEEHAYVETIVNELQQIDGRIKYTRLEQNLGISENTNNCAKMATGDYIGFLDHDDLLASNALYENAKAINETMADVLYSDEDHLSMQGEHVNPFFKPDWSPDLLYSQMYICHFTVVRHELFKALGGFRSAFDGSQDYDLMLRLSEATDRICHIPCVLYTWRECEGSTAANADAKPYAHTAGRCALDEHLKRKYGSLAHAEDSEYTFVFEPRFDNMTHTPLVSIIIPMKDKWELTDACIQSILKKSTYHNFEILILDNRSEEKKTKEWFRRIQKRDKRIRVVLADMEFNWSKLNNFGIAQSKGEVYIFLNNDTLIITPDWIERLCENALREDVGVVGALLLYEDDTIQHAGVVVGFGGWADHVFKGMSPIHYGAPFVSPMVSRNVLAVTGACMAISKRTIENIGLFDDEFIICGSDVEMCVRAYERGLFNRYDANVRLYHLESKSRDSYIPEIDFQKSYECYTPYRENIDPFFNVNLDINSVVPREKKVDMNLVNFKNFLKRCPLAVKAYEVVKRAIMEPQSYNIPEIGSIHARKTVFDNGEMRLNLLVPSVDKQHVFGGIATAINFFEELRKKLDCPARIITVDAPINPETSVAPNGYNIINSWDDSNKKRQLVAFSDRYEKTIPVAENDVFVATGWWTAYTIREVMYWQKEIYGVNLQPLIYLVQDYEPGFYPWSSRYMLADSTYRLDVPTWAVVNSSLLREYFERNDYQFEKVWHFEPVLNTNLATALKQAPDVVTKKKQIIVYGRPSTERNAFALVVAALQAWCVQQKNAEEWTVYSAGEQHDDVELGKGVFLKSVGKLSIEEYANVMLETYAGISLMVSPHPSYPPLEMSTFGIKTITNCYGNKDLSSFNDNIISLKSAAPVNIAKHLCEICDAYDGKGKVVKNGAYVEKRSVFGDVIDAIANSLENK